MGLARHARSVKLHGQRDDSLSGMMADDISGMCRDTHKRASPVIGSVVRLSPISSPNSPQIL